MTIDQLERGNIIQARIRRLDALRDNTCNMIRSNFGCCQDEENQKRISEAIRSLVADVGIVIADLKKPLIEELENL